MEFYYTRVKCELCHKKKDLSEDFTESSSYWYCDHCNIYNSIQKTAIERGTKLYLKGFIPYTSKL